MKSGAVSVIERRVLSFVLLCTSFLDMEKAYRYSESERDITLTLSYRTWNM